MVMSQALLQLLKQRHPKAVIDVVAPGWSLPILERMPEIRNSHVSPFKHGELALRARIRFGKQLQSYQYDQAIVIPNSWKSALVPFAAGIKLRTGWLGEQRWGLLNDVRQLDKKIHCRFIDKLLALGLPKKSDLNTTLPLPQLTVKPHNLQHALAQHQLCYDERPILMLCPGAAFGPSKRWPISHFAHVAQQQLQQGWQVWIMGAKQEADIALKICQLAPGCINLADKEHYVRLAPAVDLMSIADYVITNDSGLMHIAAALQRPLIALYGPTSASTTPPLSSTAQIVENALECRPCFKKTCPLQHHKCLKDISPEHVLSLLKQPQPNHTLNTT